MGLSIKQWQIYLRFFLAFTLLISTPLPLSAGDNDGKPPGSSSGSSDSSGGNDEDLDKAIEEAKKLADAAGPEAIALAKEGGTAAEHIANEALKLEDLYRERIQGLDEVLRGIRAGVHPLDPWGALSQRMVLHGKKHRTIPLNQSRMSIVIGNFHDVDPALPKDRLDDLLSKVFNKEALAAALDANGNYDAERFTDTDGSVTPLAPNTTVTTSPNLRQKTYVDLIKYLSTREATHFAWEVSQRMGIRLDEAVLMLEKLFNTENDKNTPFKEVMNRRLIRSDVDPDTNRVINADDFAGSSKEGFSTGNLMFDEPVRFNPRHPTFSLADKKTEQILMEVTVPIRSLFFYGDYLVFIEDGSGHNATTNTQYLTFVDLKKYEASIGKDSLPLFKMAVHSKKPIENIRIEDGKIRVEVDHPQKGETTETLTTAQLEQWSNLNELAYNAHVNLVDKNFAPTGAAMVGAFARYHEETQKFFQTQNAHLEGDHVEDMFAAFNEHGERLKNALEKVQAGAGSINDALAEFQKNDEIEDYDDVRSFMQDRDAVNFVQLDSLEQTMQVNGNAHMKMMRSHAHLWGFVSRMSNRTKLLISKLSIPRPFGMKVLRDSLIQIAAFANKNIKKDLQEGRYVNAAHMLQHPYAKWGSRAVVASLLAAVFPEHAGNFLYMMQNAGSAMFSGIFGFMGDMGYVVTEAFRQSLKWLNPFFLFPFIGEHAGTIGKATSMAVTYFLIAPLATVHFTKGIFRVGKAFYDSDPLEENKGNRFIRMGRYLRRMVKNASVKNFVNHARQLYKEDLDALAEAARKKQEAEEKMTAEMGAGFTDEDTKKVRELIAHFESEADEVWQSKWYLRWPSNLKKGLGWVWKGLDWSITNTAQGTIWLAKGTYNNFVRPIVRTPEWTDRAGQDKEEDPNEKIKGFASAMRRFVLSWETFKDTQVFAAKFFWNSWFLFRSFSWHPIVFMRSLLKPKFAFTIVNPEGSSVLSTPFNGTQRNLASQMWLWWARTDYGEQLDQWENAILPVEESIHAHSLKAASRGMTLFAQSEAEIFKVYQNGDITNWATGAIKQLDETSRVFFRYYTQLVQERATELYLKDVQDRVNNGEDGSDAPVDLDGIKEEALNADGGLVRGMLRVADTALSNCPLIKEAYCSVKNNLRKAKEIHQIKDDTLEDTEQLKISDEEAAEYVERAAADKSLYDEAERLAKSAIMSTDPLAGIARKAEVISQNTVQILNPHNNQQINRVMTVNGMLDDASNTARGVRFVASQYKLNYTLGVLLTFLASAGLEDGAFQLIQDDGHEGEAFMGLSSAIVIGMAFGLSLSVVGGADLWMKVQRDELHKDQFDQRLKGEDAELDLLPLWFRQTFKNKDNTFYQNYSHYWNKIVIPNLKAATWNFGVSYGVMWQRFDIGFYLIGYLLYALIPTGVLDQKMDQGFELAVSKYLATKFPPQLLAHPETQEWINKMSSIYRDVYTLANKGYEELLAGPLDSMNVISTEQHGLRTLERTLFGGYSMAELAYAGGEAAQSVLRPIPGAETVLQACEQLLTNNMPPEMFQKTQVPPWIEIPGAAGK